MTRLDQNPSLPIEDRNMLASLITKILNANPDAGLQREEVDVQVVDVYMHQYGERDWRAIYDKAVAKLAAKKR